MKPVILLSLLLLVPAAPAAGMRVEPGQWEFRSVAIPSTGREDVTKECVDEAEMTPEIFMKDAPECTVTDPQSDSSSMSWSMTCTSQGGGMSGDARFTSTGDTVEGVMNMHVRAQGMKMSMKRQWRGKRLGPCEKP